MAIWPGNRILREQLLRNESVRILFTNTKIAKNYPTEVRLGFFAGFFEYTNLAPEAKTLGVPTIDDFILQGGLTLSVGLSDDWEIQMKVIPVGQKPVAVLTLQLATTF